MKATMTFEKNFQNLKSHFSGTTGLIFKDLTTGEQFSYNGERSFSTASVIKIYVLGALLEDCQNHVKSLDDRVPVANEDDVSGSGVLKALDPGLQIRVKDLAVLMIIVSDNIATNLLIDYLGGAERVNVFIKKCGLKETILNRKISWKKEKTELGLTTPKETALYLEGLYKGEYLDAVHTAYFMDMMKKQQLHDTFVRNLPLEEGETEDTRLTAAHKTGSVMGVRNDAGYLFQGKNTYIFSAFTDGCRDLKYYCDNEANVYLGRLGQLCYDELVD